MLDTLRQRVTELEQLQQRAARMRSKSGKTEVGVAFYARAHELAERDPPVIVEGTQTVEVDTQSLAVLLQAAVDCSAATMLGID